MPHFAPNTAFFQIEREINKKSLSMSNDKLVALFCFNHVKNLDS